MRTFFSLVMVVVIAGGGFYLWQFTSRPVDRTVEAQADQFANAALAELYSASSSGVVVPSSPQESIINPTPTAPITNTSDKKYMHAVLHTSAGDVTIEFFDKDAPSTVANFTKLAASGFYDGTKFHRVIAGFMIQGGDPLSKDDSLVARWGTGGPGYNFNDEIRENNHNVIGTISMANSGPNTNGSQFFINVANNGYLDGKHTTFGKVISGMEVVDKIQQTPTDANDRPTTPIAIQSITLAE